MRWWTGFACGGRKRNNKSKIINDAFRENKQSRKDQKDATQKVPQQLGKGYVKVIANTALIDAVSLEMVHESMLALQRILEQEHRELLKGQELLQKSVNERESAQESNSHALDENNEILRKLERISNEKLDLEKQLKFLQDCLNKAKYRETELKIAFEALHEKEKNVETLEKTSSNLDKETARAQSMLKADRNTRIKLQAQLKADIEEATAATKKKEEQLRAKIKELEGTVHADRQEQENLNQVLKSFHQVFERVNADVSNLRENRTKKLEKVHEQIAKFDDSPLKAEYRRANQRWKKEKEDIEILKLQCQVLGEEEQVQEEKINSKLYPASVTSVRKKLNFSNTQKETVHQEGS